ncbi:MAG: alpha/beta hydrolase [Solirubrobacterales bacterium]|nr:alpha/beta hydrolase [Solirubrobacterales bacterium]
MSTPQHLDLEANGLRFGALAWGAEDAPLALLAHGYPDTAWTWRHLGPYLAARGRRVVAPFSRGYAPTDLAPDGSYRIADLAQDLLGLHEALGGDERAVLVGHDWGAVATYGVAAVAPTRFRRLVTIAVPPPPALLKPLTRLSTVPLGLRQTGLSWYFLYNQLPGSERTLDRLVPKLWGDWAPGYDARQDIAHVMTALDTPQRRRAAQTYYRDNLRGGLKATFTLAPQAPVLYLHGEDDGCMKADILTRFPQALPAGSRYERLPGLGHFPQLEDPDRTGALIQEWIGPA